MNQMKKILFIVFTVLPLFFLIGCATTTFRVEPRAPDMDTLLIGQIEVHVSGWPSTEMNRVHKSNIQAYLYDYAEDKWTQVTTRDEGTFYLVTSHASNKFWIGGFLVGGKTRGGTSKISLDYGKAVVVQGGQVNNLGRIVSTVKVIGRKQVGTGTKIDISTNYIVRYGEIQPWFKETFPDSEWNDKQWFDSPHLGP
jgi:hypothetical protein